MRGTRGRVTALVLVGGAASVGDALAPSLGTAHTTTSEAAVVHTAIGVAYLVVGAIAWRLRPENSTGLLLALVGPLWDLQSLDFFRNGAAQFIALHGGAFWSVQLGVVVLAFPNGRLAERIYQVAAASQVVVFLLGQMFGYSPIYTAIPSIAYVVALTHKWRSGGRATHRAMVPLLLALPVFGVASLVLVLAPVFHLPLVGTSLFRELIPLGLVALPLAFLVGLLRGQLERTAVGRLVVELATESDSAGVRGALRRALRDPALEVLYWVGPRGVFVDADGEERAASPSPRRAVTSIERGGEPVALILHEASVDDPELLDAVVAAARLAIENEQLQAEVRAQVEEIRASRARLVVAADEARRRVERDLHDGAQQRLVTLGLRLQMVAQQAAADGATAVSATLADATAELRDALAELRELARGIHPAILTEAGLPAAVASLAERCPVPVDVDVEPEGGPAGLAEITAYYVVAEALTNVARHSAATSVRVRVRRCPRGLEVLVVDDGIGLRGAPAGSGLRGLADRVAALGGSLSVDSAEGGGTRVEAVVPHPSTDTPVPADR